MGQCAHAAHHVLRSARSRHSRLLRREASWPAGVAWLRAARAGQCGNAVRAGSVTRHEPDNGRRFRPDASARRRRDGPAARGRWANAPAAPARPPRRGLPAGAAAALSGGRLWATADLLPPGATAAGLLPTGPAALLRRAAARLLSAAAAARLRAAAAGTVLNAFAAIDPHHAGTSRAGTNTKELRRHLMHDGSFARTVNGAYRFFDRRPYPADFGGGKRLGVIFLGALAFRQSEREVRALSDLTAPHGDAQPKQAFPRLRHHRRFEAVPARR